MTDEPKAAEFQRFLVLFDQMVAFTDAWLDKMPADKLDWAPIENASMRFGDRVSRITVKGLILHTCAGERHWVDEIARCAPGATIATPRNPALERDMAAGDFRAMARSLHAGNMAKLQTFGAAELDKPVVFSDRSWTGMGLLWAMVTHRAFHLGNIDIYLRQTDTVAPDFFRFPSLQMA